MHRLKKVRASLEVGFPDGQPDERQLSWRGQVYRTVPLTPVLPFEDSQFELVMLHESAVNRVAVREAHRLLRPEGFLTFIVREKTSKQAGFGLPEIYSILREGFNILEVERTPWWRFGIGGRTIAICAQKKNWRAHVNTYRPLV